MSDAYQAVYDATRRRLGNCDVAAAVERVAWQCFDISNMRALLQEQFLCAAYEMQRPSAIYRPAISIDGNMWCALYGENLRDGVAGFGESPAAAMAAFDAAWFAALPVRQTASA